MRVITLRPGEAPKFNEIPALLDTTEATVTFIVVRDGLT